jgi:hypothetical protein
VYDRIKEAGTLSAPAYHASRVLCRKMLMCLHFFYVHNVYKLAYYDHEEKLLTDFNTRNIVCLRHSESGKVILDGLINSLFI